MTPEEAYKYAKVQMVDSVLKHSRAASKGYETDVDLHRQAAADWAVIMTACRKVKYND